MSERIVERRFRPGRPQNHESVLPTRVGMVRVQTGRKRGLAMVFNTQLPNKLHLALRNECSELVCFRLQDSAVLDYPLERGFNPDELRALPDLHFISRSETGGELRGRLKL